MTKLVRIHPVHAEHDLADVIDVAQLLENVSQRRLLHFRVKRRHHQRNRARPRALRDQVLAFLEIGVRELVQRADEPVLVEIGHMRRYLPILRRNRQARLRK